MKWIKCSDQLPPEGTPVWVYKVFLAPAGNNFTMQLERHGLNFHMVGCAEAPPVITVEPFHYWYIVDKNYTIPPKVSDPNHCPECQREKI